MKLRIRHETLYHYTAPLRYTIQQLRLTPRTEHHQSVLAWEIATPGTLSAFTDAFGNACHMLTLDDVREEVRIVASGVVEVAPLDQGRLAPSTDLSPLVFTVPTRLTEADARLAEFARRHARAGMDGHAMLHLAEAIRDAVGYTSGATGVTTTAVDALQLAQGVCQDHAHLFLACCHVHGVPARYVSGYIDPGDTSHAESHAWIDAWVQDDGFEGWVSVDVTHARFTDASHCRIAIGRDYDSAAPVRGIRKGGGLESLSVKVDVSPSVA